MLIEFFYTDEIEKRVAWKEWEHFAPRKGDWVTVYADDGTVVEGYVEEIGWMQITLEYEEVEENIPLCPYQFRLTVMIQKWIKGCARIPPDLNILELTGIMQSIKKNEQEETTMCATEIHSTQEQLTKTQEILKLISDERRRQYEKLGYTPEYDDDLPGTLLCFKAGEHANRMDKENLIKAGACTVAELERLQRAADRIIKENDSRELPVCPNDDCDYSGRSKCVEYDPERGLPFCASCLTQITWEGLAVE